MRGAIIGLILVGTLSAMCADVVPGVSRELAKERKECLDSIRYNLVFHYPNHTEDTYNIEEDIIFHYAGGLKDYLQIDFDGDKVESCCANDIKINPEWKANHILIPTDLLQSGQNIIKIQCCSNNRALNSNPNYMYTLFVPANAHSVFPCFDQPDLKAKFTPALHIPKDFQCMSSMNIDSVVADKMNGTKLITFQESPLLPTYLMSWVIGDFKNSEVENMSILHNETDSLKKAQIPEMCEIASKSIRWLEEYTDVAYPFDKYDFAIIPGFQFGGMEHPGAILYPPETTFLNNNPTPEEILWRYELIAHETSHMWFGDLVTMRWFDDVWTKEVFANFMASKISSQAFPDIDHNFNFIRGNYPAAYSTDRTDGTHPIAQDLDNLNNAGLVYGNIIYYKAPIMMRMLEKRMGEERLRDGLRRYLNKYALGNSSWDELIELLDSVAPDSDVKGFSEAWVKHKGMPTIIAKYQENDKTLSISQFDSTGAGTVWPQSFSVRLIGSKGQEDIAINLFVKEYTLPVDTTNIGTVTAIIPNSKGEGYGYFKIDNIDSYRDNWHFLGDDGRYAAILNMTNAWVARNIDSEALQSILTSLLPNIDNPLIAAAAADALAIMAAQNEIEEETLWNVFETTSHPSVKQRLLRNIYSNCLNESSASLIYDIWKEQSEPLLNQLDYMSMAYRLAILRSDEANQILDIQRQRISENKNLTREFDFISRGCLQDADSLLNSLNIPENRRPEPWTTKLLSLIFDPARPIPTERIKVALDMLPDIKSTGGIFFPTQWAKAVMAGIRTTENRNFVIDYCYNINPDIPLNRKLLESSYLVRKFVQQSDK